MLCFLFPRLSGEKGQHSVVSFVSVFRRFCTSFQGGFDWLVCVRSLVGFFDEVRRRKVAYRKSRVVPCVTGCAVSDGGKEKSV